MTKHYKKGDLLDVTIEKIVPRGLGLAFADDLTVLVPLAAVGDKLRVVIREIKKHTAFADIVTVMRSGLRRVQPRCELYGRCGGCDMQHIDYYAQLTAKKEFIRDCLHRIGNIDFDVEIAMIPCPHELGYRSRARWHIDSQRRAFGFYARESHDVIDVIYCPILSPSLQSSLDYLRESTNWNTITSDMATIEAASNEKGHVSIYSRESNGSARELSTSVAGETYTFSAKVFFQANEFLIAELIGAALGGVKGDTAIELYSGVGLFTLPLARRFSKVVAVEDNPEALRFAKMNLDNAGLHNVTLISRNVERFLCQKVTEPVDFVLLDPPRAGTAKNVVSRIAKLRPSLISYVSCEPSILARDLRTLIDAGYRIEAITALDMFPQTHHVETVVRLSSVART